MSLRARAVVYATDRVSSDSIVTDLGGYIDLAASAWEGRVAVRSSGNIYNQSLIAAVIANFGPERAEQWARGVVGNFARPPSGGDRDQIRAVAAGEADVAIVNSYYYALMLGSEESDFDQQYGDLFPDRRPDGHACQRQRRWRCPARAPSRVGTRVYRIPCLSGSPVSVRPDQQ